MCGVDGALLPVKAFFMAVQFPWLARLLRVRSVGARIVSAHLLSIVLVAGLSWDAGAKVDEERAPKAAPTGHTVDLSPGGRFSLSAFPLTPELLAGAPKDDVDRLGTLLCPLPFRIWKGRGSPTLGQLTH